MEKITVKTKIKMRTKTGKREGIIFKKFDMTTKQVAAVNKLLKNAKDEHVRLTINIDKSFGMPDIISNAQFVKVILLSDGQLVTIKGFSTPSTLVGTLENYIENETEVTLTIEQLQGKIKTEEEESLPFDGERNAATEEDPEDGFDDNLPGGPDDKLTDGADEKPKDIELNLPLKWNAQCYIKIGKVGENWQYGFIIKIGNTDLGKAFEDSVEYDELEDCIYNLKQELDAFIDAQENFKQIKPLKKKIEKAIEDWKFDNT